MNDKKKWNRRLAPHIYDYNYKVGESYYTPQTEYIENRELLRSRPTPPEAQSFAERYASRPIYGNTRGLPYDSASSALSKPLVNRRAQSTGRARSRDREVDDFPSTSASTSASASASASASRLGRSRDRKVSFNADDYLPKFNKDDYMAKISKDDYVPKFNKDDYMAKISKDDYVPKFNMDDYLAKFNKDDYLTKFSVDDELNYQVAPKRYSTAARQIASEEDFDINPRLKKELEDEFKRIKQEFKKADSIERGSVPRTSQYEETVYDSGLGVPGKRRVKREEVSYNLPPTGTKIRKSSYTESTKFESSKPPRIPKPSRFGSIDNDMDFKLPKTPRLRKFSMSEIDDDDFNLKYQSPRPRSRNRTVEEEKKFQQGLSIREQRRAQESEQLSSNISSLVNKMKSHDLDDGHKYTRTIRSSSLDPYEREPRAKARIQARAHQFAYGVSK